ncbi:MAG: glycoside hydrolase family 88 protein, partial [Clostridia bacterium]|nr:glycoside hydrolase family 88 protein [Clostridia bacterium]
WLESSCTCLYAAALCMAVRQGFMEPDALKPALKAVKGIFERLGEDENGLLIGNVCVGTGVGDYPFYCARPTSTNDLHGVGAFLLMCAEAAKSV